MKNFIFVLLTVVLLKTSTGKSTMITMKVQLYFKVKKLSLPKFDVGQFKYHMTPQKGRDMLSRKIGGIWEEGE